MIRTFPVRPPAGFDSAAAAYGSNAQFGQDPVGSVQVLQTRQGTSLPGRPGEMDYIENITCERVKKVIEKIKKAHCFTPELKTIDTFNEADTIGRLNDNMRYPPLGEIDDEKAMASIEGEKKPQ